MAIFGWGFFYFVFLKIYTTIVYSVSVSLVGAAVMAIVISGIQLIVSVAFRLTIVEQLSNRHVERTASQLSKFWTAYIVTLPVIVVACVLISIGFSERFYAREFQGGYRDFLGLDWANVVVFMIGITVMTLPEIILTHIGLKAVSRGDFDGNA